MTETDDKVTMEDYLDDLDEDPEPATTDEEYEYPYPYRRNKNEHGTPQRCRYCGEDFPTAGRRNHWLNRHQSHCDAKEEYYDAE